MMPIGNDNNPPHKTRIINSPGIINMRDLGGLPLINGGIIRSGCLLRSASLSHLTLEEAKPLTSLTFPLRIFDLRTQKETEMSGVPSTLIELGAEVLHRPLSDPGFLKGIDRPTSKDYLKSYLNLVDGAIPVVHEICSKIMDDPFRTTIVSCTAGKDRTGLVIGLLLSALGVSIKNISRDYALSARQLRSKLYHFRHHWEKRGITSQQYAIRLETQASTMVSLLSMTQVKERLIQVNAPNISHLIEGARRLVVSYKS